MTTTDIAAIARGQGLPRSYAEIFALALDNARARAFASYMRRRAHLAKEPGE